MSGAASTSDPHVKSILRVGWRGAHVRLLAPCSTFSCGAIDPGTLLLLGSLPGDEPRRFFDLGCGYGALGLTLAAKLPGARGTLVDRDLLAVEYCRRNAGELGLKNVEVLGSLGWSRVGPEHGAYDWVLANLPARAGEAVFARLLAESAARLAPNGAIHCVVIAPFREALERAAGAQGLQAERVGETSQHAAYSIRPAPGWTAGPALAALDLPAYERDRISLALPGLAQPLELIRPTDLADEPHRLAESVPLLVGALPELLGGGARALSFRAGYGLIPALLLERYPELEVVAVDRDLLGTEQTRRNCARFAGRLEVVEAPKLAESSVPPASFDLVVGELLPPLGPQASLEELRAARRFLRPGGCALVAGLKKEWREVLDAQERARWKLIGAGKVAAVHGAQG